MSDSWYETVTSDSLEQGDILAAFPVTVANLSIQEMEAIASNRAEPNELACPVEVQIVDVVVMTQSCDLENGKVDSVLLCPMWREEEFQATRSEKETIRKGGNFAVHLLNKDDRLGLPYSFVEFSRIYTSPKANVAAFARLKGSRPRLLSPYREHLSQAFARFFMRVGLPSSIPQFR